MSSSLCSGSLLFLMLCTFIVPMGSSLVNVYGAGQTIVFSRTPSGYNNQTGAFTLSMQLTNDGWRKAGDRVCVMYDYFIFNAQAGQVLQGGAQGSTGKLIYYMILNSPYQLYSFQNSNCEAGWGQVAASASTINWTAPKDGQYALLFLTSGFYGGKVYFTQ